MENQSGYWPLTPHNGPVHLSLSNRPWTIINLHARVYTRSEIVTLAICMLYNTWQAGKNYICVDTFAHRHTFHSVPWEFVTSFTGVDARQQELYHGWPVDGSIHVTTLGVHEEDTQPQMTAGAAHLSVKSYLIDCKAFAAPYVRACTWMGERWVQD